MMSPETVSGAEHGLFILAGPTDDTAEGLSIIGRIASSVVPGAHVLDLRGQYSGDIDNTVLAATATRALVVLEIRDAADAKFAVDLSRTSPVVARLHARPARADVSARLSQLLGDTSSLNDDDWQLIETRRARDLSN